jgi:hypothetical protein
MNNLINLRKMKNLIEKLIILLSLCLNLNLYLFSQGVSINTIGASADNSAILDISSTSQGLLIPRMTTTQRNNISSPATSLLIFNTTTNCFEAYVNNLWYSVYCPPACNPPSSPIAGINSPSQTQIIWNWNFVSGATGFKWNTTNIYATANDNGTSTNYIQSGLTCNTSNTLYIWSYNSCGNSSSTTLIQKTSNCWTNCGNDLVITHTAGSVAPISRTVTYGTLLTNISGSNECWITQNLGAVHQATSGTDTTDAAAGWYWQFDAQQGYDNNGKILIPSNWSASYGSDGSWIIENDPCNLLLGTGWRIPTYTEWNNTMSGWNGSSYAYASVLKVHAAGGMNQINGALMGRGISGYYYSSMQYDAANGEALGFGINYRFYYNNSKVCAFTLRCVNP